MREAQYQRGDVLRMVAKFGGMDVSQARRLRGLEEENARLKHWWPIRPFRFRFSKK